MTIRAGVSPEMRSVARVKKQKMTETFMCQTGYLPRAPTSTQPPEILHAGSCPVDRYTFKVSWNSVEGSRSCGGRNFPLPSTWPMAYTTACTTVQAVIIILQDEMQSLRSTFLKLWTHT